MSVVTGPGIGWVLWLAAHAVLQAQPAGAPAPGPEYDLRIGGATYPVAPGQPFTITTPKGEKLQVVLTFRDPLHFESDGVAFDYPRAMHVTAKREEGMVAVTVRSTGHYFAQIALLPADEAGPGTL